MNNREKTKIETRQKILAITKQEFIAHGLLGLSTVSIAKQAGVAHGTVFFHFQTKENLIVEVLDIELLKITAELNIILKDTKDLRSLLGKYLDFVASEEPLLAVIARETPFYPPILRRVILGREGAIRRYFYASLNQEMALGSCKQMDPTAVLTFLFATIHYYLSLREAYTDGPSVILEKRALILQTFMQFVTRE